MNANDVIEAYVTEVALQLPKKQRNDVAFELRALLAEELQGNAEAAGRAADAAMALELVQTWGRPEEVALRYRPTLTIIDPADGHNFLRATVIGLAILWGLGLVIVLRRPIASGGDVLTALGQWWASIVIPSLWWPGMLVVGYGVAAWSRRRWPQTSVWKPRAADRLYGGRLAMVMALFAILCGISVLLDPRRVLEVVWGGRAAPAAYQALTYTETFLERQAPWVLGLLLLNIPLFLVVIVMGRGSSVQRRIETVLSLGTCAVLGWTVLDGPVFMAEASDRTAKFFLVLIVAFTLIGIAIQLHRRVRPSPNPRMQA